MNLAIDGLAGGTVRIGDGPELAILGSSPIEPEYEYIRSDTGSADQWCTACRAHDALQRAGEAPPCGTPTEWDQYDSPVHWCARPRGHGVPCAADPFTLDLKGQAS